MKLQRRGILLPDKQFHAEVRRILRLLEHTRRTRRMVRLLIALETGGSKGLRIFRPRLPKPAVKR
jgi:hypothetical protein